MIDLTNNPQIQQARSAMDPQFLDAQVTSLIQDVRQRSARYIRNGWILMGVGLVLLILPGILIVIQCPVPLVIISGMLAMVALALIPVGRYIWDKGKRIEVFCQPHAALTYILCLIVRDNLVNGHANEWYCHKCHTWNGTAVGSCSKCGAVFDYALSKCEFDNTLRSLDDVIALMN